MQRVLIVPQDVLKDLPPSFLDRRSFVVRTAGTAREALAITAAWAPDLIIFSNGLGDMSPVQLCATIRTRGRISDDRLQRVRLLMVSDAIGVSRDELASMEVDSHLVSPIEEEELLQTIAALLAVPFRRSPRVAVETLAQVEELGNQRGEPVRSLGNVLSISECGLLLESELRLRLNGPYRVQFFLPGVDEPLAPTGQPLYLADEVQLHYAVKFTDVNARERELIRGFVESRVGAPTESGA